MESHPWVQTDKHDLVPCKCNFAALKSAKLNKHYRVRLREDRLAHSADRGTCILRSSGILPAFDHLLIERRIEFPYPISGLPVVLIGSPHPSRHVLYVVRVRLTGVVGRIALALVARALE